MIKGRVARGVVPVAAGILLLLTAGGSPAGAEPVPGVRSPAQLAGAGAAPAGCAAPTGPRVAHCYLAAAPAPAPASVRPGLTCLVSPEHGWTPCNLQNAYQLTVAAGTRGHSQTVAIVDAYDDPNAEADLGKYRTHFGLPQCTTANGCFKKVNQNGVQGSYPPGNMGWGQEITIDLATVSAICPKCHILLVEANSNGFGDLFAAEQEAIHLGAHIVSNSWGTGEFSGETSYDGTLNTTGVAITFSSGDGAYQGGVQYPSASPYVTSVGGTMLIPAIGGRGWTEKTWVTPGAPPTQGSGSGCSAYEDKPSWQTDRGCAMRTTADVSAVAANVLAYDSYQPSGGGWYFFFGTSISSPLTAAVYGLASNAASQTVPPASLAYANRTRLYDISRGLATGTCSPRYLCKAAIGYDGPTGLGTPKGVGAY